MLERNEEARKPDMDTYNEQIWERIWALKPLIEAHRDEAKRSITSPIRSPAPSSKPMSIACYSLSSTAVRISIL